MVSSLVGDHSPWYNVYTNGVARAGEMQCREAATVWQVQRTQGLASRCTSGEALIRRLKLVAAPMGS
jgi:hypothetical protein